MRRDVEPGPPTLRTDARVGRSVIAVIGIDHYAEWPRLENAVSDAAAVSRLFRRLGFEEITAPLLDTTATGEAMRRLVTDDLAQLSSDDSLVLFFAGHGHTHTARFGDLSVKTGCVIPVDALCPTGHVSSSWLRLDTWLSDIARLPPRHILVIVDACRSGVALSALHRWRDEGAEPAELAALQSRRSRRIITSALDDQCAMDSGPYPGHSLFTGCLIDALSGGLTERGRRVATGREIGQYLQKRVGSYPPSTQTPDFGTFELDDRGDIVVPLKLEESGAGSAAPPSFGTGSRQIATDPRRRISSQAGLLARALVVGIVLFGSVGDGSAPYGLVTGDARDARPSASSMFTTAPPEPAAIVAPSGPGAANAETARTTGPMPFRHGTRKKPSSTLRSLDQSHSSHAPEEQPTTQTPAKSTPAVPKDTTDDSGNTPPVASPPILAPAADKCSKAAFAVVYKADAPGPDAVHAALRTLKACRDAGAVSAADFDRYQAALIAKR